MENRHVEYSAAKEKQSVDLCDVMGVGFALIKRKETDRRKFLSLLYFEWR
jgi:hypothetical protein